MQFRTPNDVGVSCVFGFTAGLGLAASENVWKILAAMFCLCRETNTKYSRKIRSSDGLSRLSLRPYGM